MINLYQIQRINKPEDVVFVGSLQDASALCRQANAMVEKPIFEIGDITLKALSLRDELKKKTIFSFIGDKGEPLTIYTLHEQPKYFGGPRSMEDYYGSRYAETETGLYLPPAYKPIQTVSARERVKVYLEKLKADGQLTIKPKKNETKKNHSKK